MILNFDFDLLCRTSPGVVVGVEFISNETMVLNQTSLYNFLVPAFPPVPLSHEKVTAPLKLSMIIYK